LETEICGQRLSTARAANEPRRRPKRLGRPTDAAASRGTVVLFCRGGNHSGLRGTTWWWTQSCETGLGDYNCQLTGKITGNIAIFSWFGRNLPETCAFSVPYEGNSLSRKTGNIFQQTGNSRGETGNSESRIGKSVSRRWVRDHDLVRLKHIHWLSHVRKIAERRKSPTPIGERPVATGITRRRAAGCLVSFFRKAAASTVKGFRIDWRRRLVGQSDVGLDGTASAAA